MSAVVFSTIRWKDDRACISCPHESPPIRAYLATQAQ